MTRFIDLTATHRKLLVALVTAAAVVASPVSAAGQSAVEDTEGRSTVMLQSSSIGINVADSSIQIAFTPLNSTRRVLYGIKVKGKAANGLAPLIANGELQPGLELGTTIGYKLGDGADAVGLKMSLSAARLTLFDPAANPDTALLKQTHRTGEVGLVGNFVVDAPGGDKLGFATVGISARRLNNWDDLKKNKIIRRETSLLENGAGTQEVVTEIEARSGTLQEGWIGSLDGDFIAFSSALPVSARAYVRLGLGGEDALRHSRFGFDVAFIKPGGDLLWDRLASVFFEFDDPPADAQPSSWTIGLAASLPLSIFGP
jgi:hypothetical protein